METLELARIQFASTTIFHYFFVPLSIGLAFIIAIMQTLYVVKGQAVYKKMAKFWTQLFLINFAVGVVTGILQEFQFGMNWSTYSRFVGDVFGPSLAIEGLLAFFIESTFLGLWVFGEDKLPKRIHLLCIQNPQLWVQFPHTITAAIATGAFFIAGVSAWKITKGQETVVFKKSFRISIIVGTITTALVLFFGHAQAQQLIKTHPMKMAAAEALWNTSEDPAPFTVFAKIDTEKKENSFEIQIPYMLSLLSYDKFSGQVEGMNQIQKQYEEKYGPGDYIPPVHTMFWSFRAMVMSGTFMLLLGAYGWFLSRKDRLAEKTWYLKVMVYAISLPFIGNTVGWIMTEMGRQPWVVFGVMKTEDAVSPNVTFGEVLFSLISFTSMYLIMGGICVYLFVRTIKGHTNKKTKKDYQSHDPFDKEEEYVIS